MGFINDAAANPGIFSSSGPMLTLDSTGAVSATALFDAANPGGVSVYDGSPVSDGLNVKLAIVYNNSDASNVTVGYFVNGSQVGTHSFGSNPPVIDHIFLRSFLLAGGTVSNLLVSVITRPEITTSPASQALDANGSSTLTVAGTGSALTYQWYLNGGAINGATSSSYAISTAGLADAGNYTVVVGNAAGAATSSAATLTVRGLASNEFTYSTDGSTVTITGYIGAGGAVTIPASIFSLPVTAIGSQAFNGKSSITSVSVPSGVTLIDDAAFQNCTSLTSVSLPGTLTEIRHAAFSGCSALTGISLPSSMVTIRNSAFLNCTHLASIALPENLTNLEIGAFQNCTALTTITVASENPAYTATSDHLAVLDKTGTTLIAFANGFTGAYAVPGTVTSIADSAFQGCIGLSGINLPNGLTAIGNGAFYDCRGLIALNLPSNLTSIGYLAFANCTGLTTITIPPSLTTLGYTSFIGCSNLTIVYFLGAAPTAGDNAFSGTGVTSVYYAAGLSSWPAALSGVPTAPYVSPSITVAPVGSSLKAGGNYTLSVTAAGTPPLSYQWYHNGDAINGATTASLPLSNTTVQNGGNYSVKASNLSGSALSASNDSLAGGMLHTLFIKTDGTLWAAGTNDYGQLGDGSTVDRLSPVQVASQVKAVACGASHSLILKTDGTLWATGLNNHGQLGDGTTTDRNTPVQIAANVTAIAAGYWHSMFVKADGTLWVFGWNGYWQLGLGEGVGDSSTPVLLASGVAKIAAGCAHSMFIKTDGTLYGVGYNTYGALGDGTITNRSTPVPIDSNVLSVTAGYWHTLYVKSDGTLYGMGQNAYGELGDGTNSMRNTPVLLASGVMSAKAGYNHSFFIKREGALWGTGHNGSGQLGDGTMTDRNTYEQVAGDVTLVAGGAVHSLYITSDGKLRGMGQNNSAQLGDGTKADMRLSPVLIANGVMTPALVKIYALIGLTAQPQSTTVPIGNGASLSVTASGTPPFTYQWYLNGIAIDGATGATYAIPSADPSMNGSYTVTVSDPVETVTSNPAVLHVDVPPSIATAPSARQTVNTGENLTLTVSVTASPTASYQWMHNGLAIGGATSSSYTITDASAIRDNGWYQLVATNYLGHASTAPIFVNVTANPAQVVAWGDNSAGQKNIPAGLSAVSALAGGSSHLLALKPDGTVVAWGYNGNGQTDVPVGLGNVVGLAANGHNLALKADGTVVAWGYNASGQATVPGGITSVVGVAAGSDNSLALKSDGTVVGWGSNAHGQITIPADLANVIAIAAGQSHCVALKSDGTVVAWGLDTSGQATVPANLAGVVAITAGNAHTVALKSDGTVVAWGNNNSGQTSVPDGLANVVAIGAAGGGETTLALKSDGTVVAWGNNTGGMATVPPGASPAVGLAAGGNYCAVLRDTTHDALPAFTTQPAASQMVGTGHDLTLSAVVSSTPGSTYQWMHDGMPVSGATAASFAITSASVAHDNGWYQLVATNYLGSTTSAVAFVNVTANPAQVMVWGDNTAGQTNVPAGLTAVAALAGGSSHLLALKPDGTVVAWGHNGNGETDIPNGLGNVVRISAAGHNLVLKSDGTVVAWGYNGSGQATVPGGLTNVVAVAAGSESSLALKSDGTVVGWGSNAYGQTTIPGNLANVVAIASGQSHSVALKSDGTVVAWGLNSSGQATVPVSLSGVVAVAAGNAHTLALKSDGTLVAWGSNSSSQSTVPPGLTNVVAIGAAQGAETCLALKSDGTVVAWGNNAGGMATVPIGASPAVGVAGGGNFSAILRDTTNDVLPAITTQPTAQLASVGDSASFSAAATGVPLPTLQWQRQANGAGAWVDLAESGAYFGTTTGTLAVNPASHAMNGDQFRCVFTNHAGSVTSNAAELTVNLLSQTITFPNLGAQAYRAAPFALGATASSGLTVSYAVQSGPATLNGSNLTLTGTGTVYVTASQAGDGVTYSAAPDVTVGFAVGPDFASWQHDNFASSDPAVIGPDVVLGQDGLSNLLKYTLGLPANANATTGLPVVTNDGTNWIYTFTKPTAVTDVTLTVQVSTDLTNWTSTGVVTHAVSSGGTETWTATYLVSSAANIFFRLQVVLP